MRRDSVWAVGMIRNEADIIAFTVSHLIAEGVNGIILCNHCSDDQTTETLYELGQRYQGYLKIVENKDPAYLQDTITTSLAEMAYDRGAEWILPFDADELFCPIDNGPTLVEVLSDSRKDIPVCGIQMWSHTHTGKDDPNIINPFVRMKYKHKERNPLDKVVVWWHEGMKIDRGNHRVFDKNGNVIEGAWVGLVLKHFPYRSPEQFLLRILSHQSGLKAAGDKTPLDSSIHNRAFIRVYEEGGAEALTELYKQQFFNQEPDGILDLDPARYRGDLQ